MYHIFYLHGLASSARSTKARFLAERLASLGLILHCPDFNEPDFSTLTVSRMIGQVEGKIADLRPGPVALIGSSLGALVALHVAARCVDRGAANSVGEAGPSSVSDPGRIERLILLAPALEFGRNRMRQLGAAGLARWRETDRLDLFHHGYGEVRGVHFALYEDAAQYDSFAAQVPIPILILQGRRDASVDPASVERFARGRSNVILHLLDDEHQLKDSMERIWKETAAFLRLDTGRNRGRGAGRQGPELGDPGAAVSEARTVGGVESAQDAKKRILQ